MIILLLFIIAGLFGTIHAFIFQSKYNKQIDLIMFEKAREEQEKHNKKLSNTRVELYKQLAAVQYQLKLLETLDGFRSDDMSDEKKVRKALALEKQYNALWTKERKLKQELEKLSS